MILLPTTYFGNTDYYSTLISGEKIVIEAYESFPKQTYRNRCLLMSANGVIPIIVPTLHRKDGGKIVTVDVLIDNSMPWQRNAWRAIISAYRHSPYFDHYESLIELFFSVKYDSLLEMNHNAMSAVLKMLSVSPDISYTTDYVNQRDITDDTTDLRDYFTPKRKETNQIGRYYYQVFSDRMPFVPNLSILDLLFCEGTNAIHILKK